MECLFCKIVHREARAEVIYEDTAALAFLDIHPRASGHAMVVPKTHAGTLLEVKPKDIGPLFTAVQAVTRLLLKTLSPQGFTIGINHGKVSGQVVDHLHIHIIPRFEGDGGGSIHSVVTHPPKQDLSLVARRIREA